MNPFRKLLLVSAFLCVAANAQERITIDCDANSSVHITYTDANGRQQYDSWPDSDGNGKVSFVIPAGVRAVNVSAMSDRREIRYVVKLPNNT